MAFGEFRGLGFSTPGPSAQMMAGGQGPGTVT